MKRNLVPALALLFLSCSAGDTTAESGPAYPVAWELTEGVQSPESAYYDADSGFLFVSQIGGGGPTGKDGDGYISKLTADGRMEALKWVAGLNAPKGLRSHGGRLWVSDIDQIVGVDIAEGRIAQRIEVPEAKFLNDVACDEGGAVYVSDMRANRIYRYADGELDVFAEVDEAESPNGLLVVGNRLVVAGWGAGADKPGRLYALDLKTAEKAFITPEPLGSLDGLETVAEGRYLVSDWSAGKIFYVNTDGAARTILELPQGSADIGYLPERQLLIVPQMMENKITAYRLRRPEATGQE
jgi:sugar lactone lactonase YvrE